jgi:cell wall-associated NlpC family hydrolase
VLLFALAAPALGSETYIVKSGDTLESIAKRHGVSKRALADANSLANANKLQLGQRLVLPGKTTVASPSSGGTYQVAKGDTDVKIAKRAGLPVAKLHELNPGIDWRHLQIGQSIRLASPPVAKKQAQQKSATAAKPAAAVAKAAETQSRFVAISPNRVNVRQTASTSAPKVAVVSQGAVARILETKGEWRKVQFAGGIEGWVRQDMLNPSSESAYTTASRIAASHPKSDRVASNARTYDKEDLLGFAKRMIGVRYRYGAMSRSATDCSGFTSQVFRSQGIKLPRTSYQQATVGQYVSRESLKAGDLVFFRTGRGSRISHVGIYIGNNQFIHASTGSYRVTIDSLGSRYYNSRYVTGRRVGNFSPEKKSIPYVVRNDEVEIPDVEDEIPVVEDETTPTQGYDAPIG